MNRQEAIDFIHQTAQHLERLGEHNPAKALEIALETILPTPDPITGLVPCGCGGQGLFEGAYLDEEVPSSYRVCLSCAECGMSTAEYEYEQEAMRAWNTAMGWEGGAE